MSDRGANGRDHQMVLSGLWTLPESIRAAATDSPRSFGKGVIGRWIGNSEGKGIFEAGN
jgi:hypothetical protein